MVHFATLKQIFENKPNTIALFQQSYIAYTILIIFVSGFVVSSLEESKNDQTCEEWSTLPQLNGDDDYNTTALASFQVCTKLVSGQAEVLKVNGAASFMAVIFIRHLFAISRKFIAIVKKVAPILFRPSEGSIVKGSSDAILTYIYCKSVIIVCVEIVGLWMIFYSTSNHEVIINSTAAFFLCELDTYILDSIVQYYLLTNPIQGEYDIGLVNIEFSTADVPEYIAERRRLAAQVHPTNEKDANEANLPVVPT